MIANVLLGREGSFGVQLNLLVYKISRLLDPPCLYQRGFVKPSSEILSDQPCGVNCGYGGGDNLACQVGLTIVAIVYRFLFRLLPHARPNPLK